LFDASNTRLTPTHTAKAGKRYRYYISNNLVTGTKRRKLTPTEGTRLSAQEIEGHVIKALTNFLSDPQKLMAAFASAELDPATATNSIQQAKALSQDLTGKDIKEIYEHVRDLVTRVQVDVSSITITIDRKALSEELGIPDHADPEKCIIITLPAELRRLGKEKRLIIAAHAPASNQDVNLIKAIVRANKWFAMLRDGDVASISDIARSEKLQRSYVSALMPFVAPIGPDDEHPRPASQAITRQGDLWTLGRHLLLCGDAKSEASIAQVMSGCKADMIFTDPPYNLKIDGHVSGLGATHHREFAEASGEMSKAGFTSFLSQSLSLAAGACRDGAIAYVCMDWRHLGEALAAGYETFSELKNLCVWAKTNGGMGTFYRSQHEMVLVWKVGTAPHTNTFGLGDKGRYRTNVWTYPGVNTFKSDRMEELKSHPTVKPVALVSDAIRDVSNRGEFILDTFGGSGTTLIAAEKTGRRARLIELDPVYCDITIWRWEKVTGKQAILSGTGETFENVKATRLSPKMEIAS